MLTYNTYDAACPMDENRRNQVLSIMEEAFPATERRVRAGQEALFDHPLYCVHTAEEDGRILGFMAAWKTQGFAFFEHFAVDSSLRGGGVGGAFLDWLLENNAPVVFEVELPTDEMTRRRIGFYRRHGAILNEREYAQLPLREGDDPTPMFLMSYPQGLTDEQFVHARKEIYRHVYGEEE